jgi:hypothetical protein
MVFSLLSQPVIPAFHFLSAGKLSTDSNAGNTVGRFFFFTLFSFISCPAVRIMAADLFFNITEFQWGGWLFLFALALFTFSGLAYRCRC